MEAKKIRLLTEDEIECRVAQCGMGKYGAWCTLLLYKDARVDMRILDEVYGQSNWQREHSLIGDRLYCTISIFDAEKGVWIKKQDVGTESNSEPEKGQASDAFKRAAFNVGIGRELYTAPYICGDLEEGEFSTFKDKNNKDKVTPKLGLHVADLGYDNDGNINLLVLMDRRGRVRYSLGQPMQHQPAPAPQPKQKTLMDQNHKGWQKMCDSVVAGQYTIQQIAQMYDLPNYAEAALKDYVTSKQF